MNHIEFLGPPGAGKSTIFSEVIKEDRYYGGIVDDAITRMFYQQAGLKYEIPYRLLPNIIKKHFNHELAQYRLVNKAIESFIRDYPCFIPVLSSAMDSAMHEPERLFTFCMRSAKDYQIGISNLKEDEILCLDEGFVHRAFSILMRCDTDTFSINEYFDSVPIPDLVIYVTAPVDVCMERQYSRGRVVADVAWNETQPKFVQERFHELCEQVKTEVEQFAPVITVENKNDIEKTVAEVFAKVEASGLV